MGLFGSKKKNVGGEEILAVPPRFAPEEVHTAYKEALQKDSLPATQLPPEQTPQTLQPAPVQDSLTPISPAADAQVPPSSEPSSLDEAVNNTISPDAQPSAPLVEVPSSGPAADPLTTAADLPVPPIEQAPEKEAVLDQAPTQDSLAPDGEIPVAPSPEPDMPLADAQVPPSSEPSSIDQAVKDAPLEENSPPLVDAPKTTYVPHTTGLIQDYSQDSGPDLPEEFPVADVQAADDLSPIAPQETGLVEEANEDFDNSQLPEIGVPVDKYVSNMAASQDDLTQEPEPSDIVPPAVMLPDLEPPQKPGDLPSTMPEDNPDDLVAPEIAPLDDSTSVYNDFSEDPSLLPPSEPSAPSEPQLALNQNSISPIEERVIFKHAMGTDVFVEKFVYEDVLLDVSGVQKDLQNAGSHLDKVFRDELAVTKKIDDWNKALNVIQEKLMTVDVRLFEKGDVQ